MTNKNITIIILIALIMGTLIYAQSIDINLPDNNQGYAPKQPINFSHRLHAGDLQLDCLYCHTGADKSRHAGVPPASVCMNCHNFVTAPWDMVQLEEENAKKENRDLQIPVSDELAKLYAAVGFNTEKMKYDESLTKKPIEWNRVHNIPAYVYFDHRRHVNAEVSCQQCHGAVETMETLSQESDLSMGWCVNCHRDVNSGKLSDLVGKNASTNCAGCHY
ncbi:MAG: hypothetical protein DWQ06_16255 [Calditrichaeota bacterium]|nr:MAG: hypothetical protein DWQ06_16255 [Calditrichota bacterium]